MSDLQEENCHEHLMSLLEWFVKDSLGGPISPGAVNFKRWEDDWATLERSTLSRRKCGFDLLVQVFYKAHMAFIEQLEEDAEPGSSKATQSLANSFIGIMPLVPRPQSKAVVFSDDKTPDPIKRKIFAPETMAVDQIICSSDDTCKIVPETQIGSDHEEGTKQRLKRRLSPATEEQTDEDTLIEDNFDDVTDVVKTTPVTNDTTKRGRGARAAAVVTKKPSVVVVGKKRSKKSEKTSREEGNREKDEGIRAKYPKLDKVFTTHDTSHYDNRGIFGVGESPNFRGLPTKTEGFSPQEPVAENIKTESAAPPACEISLPIEEQSPSILTKRSWAGTSNSSSSDHAESKSKMVSPPPAPPIVREQVERKWLTGAADSDDDFNDSPSSGRINKMSKKKKASSAGVTASNKWGIEVSELTASQMKKHEGLKQGKITDVFRKGGQSSGEVKNPKVKSERETAEESELQRALELSRQEHLASEAATAHRQLTSTEAPKVKRTPLSPINHDDSFNTVPEARAPEGKVLGKARKKLLVGHECRECHEFYEGMDLSDEEIAKLKDKCSRHRSTKDRLEKSPTSGVFRLPDSQLFDSPRERWEIEMKEDREGEGGPEKTQLGSPLRTRRVRREERNTKH